MKFDSEWLKSGGEGKGLAGVFSSRGLSVPLSSPFFVLFLLSRRPKGGMFVGRKRERERRERGHSRENDLESEKEEKRRFRSGDRERRKEVQLCVTTGHVAPCIVHGRSLTHTWREGGRRTRTNE